MPTICRKTGSFSPHLTLAAAGCALSHRKAWETLLADPKAEHALIMEDDLSAIAPNLKDKLQQLLQSALPRTWQLCFLGFHESSGNNNNNNNNNNNGSSASSASISRRVSCALSPPFSTLTQLPHHNTSSVRSPPLTLASLPQASCCQRAPRLVSSTCQTAHASLVSPQGPEPWSTACLPDSRPHARVPAVKGLFAYLLSRKGAQALLKHGAIFPLRRQVSP